MKYFFKFTFLLFSLFINAQSSFKEGYLVTQQGDTIHGEIKIQAADKNFRECIFRKGNTERIYAPSELSGFGLSDGTFYTSGLPVDFFAEQLVKGPLDLYMVFNDFYVKKNTTLYRLKYIPPQLLAESGNSNTTNIDWRSTILELVSDCLEDHERKIMKMGFSAKNLTEVVIAYNECKGGSFTEFKAEVPWVKLEYGLLSGGNATYVRNGGITNAETYYMEKPYTSIDPALGFLVSASFPRRGSGNLSLDAEIHLSRSSFQTDMAESRNASFADLNDIRAYYRNEIALTTLNLPFSLRYAIPVANNEFFFQGGLNIDLNISNSGVQRTELLGPGYVEGELDEDIQIASNTYFGPWGGLGIQHGFDTFSAGFALRYYYLLKVKETNIATPDFSRLSANLIFKI